MKRVLMSITPEYFEKIANHVKCYEYRKRKCHFHIEAIVFYVRKPIGKIMGEVSVEEPIEGMPEEVWKLTGEKAGVSREELLAYCGRADWVYAYPIREVTIYDTPYMLEDFGRKWPPQSFYYL